MFNDGSFDALRRPESATERLIPLAHGEPIRFGTPGPDGLGSRVVVRDGFGVRVAHAEDVDPGDVVVHDQHDQHLAHALARLSRTDLTHVVTGVFLDVERPTYDDAAREQVAAAKAQNENGPGLRALLEGRDPWVVPKVDPNP